MIKKILEIACNLQVRKDCKNEYGNYQYRSAEQIYENLKPLLCEYGICLTFSEDIIQAGDKHYLKCIAYLIDIESKDIIERSTIVEIDASLKGMSQSQKLGACISYARKYLLCGIFLIDNGEDLDKINPKKQLFSHSEKVEITIGKLNKIKDVQKLLNFKELVKQRDINVYNDESVRLAFKYQYNMIINNLKNSKWYMEIKNYFELGKIAFGLFLMRKQILTFFSDLAKDYYDEYVDKIDKTQKISMSDTKYMKLIQSFIDNEDAYNDFICEYNTEETSDENIDITDVYDMSLKIAYLNYRFSKDSKIDERLIQRLKDLEYNLLMKLLKNMINN